MNIADRSLALIDLALRRRFAFVTLQPHYNQAWKARLMSHSTDTDAAQIADSIAVGVSALNERITAEPTLGANFVVGHSFFTLDDQVDDLQGSGSTARWSPRSAPAARVLVRRSRRPRINPAMTSVMSCQ